ncbi:stress response protein NST1 [Lucilia cuprina]|uniref:stress response protein NST1 n=1 Tax=Lucilia cuprina TaxID=7375 RepID=UPI001F0686D8|nr:stress response protein NST1 [Lucilia cuprina]
MSMIVLSIMLLFGIVKENPGLIVPWIIGYITFMALEAVAMVYSNVLRDHVNKQFDAMCKAEVAFFIARAFINVLSMWGVLRFYNLVRSGITWRGPEAKTTLTTATNNTLAKSYNECQHHHHHHQQHHQHLNQQQHYKQHYQNSRARRHSSATHNKTTIGCCAFFDIDDYDYDFENDEDYDYEGDDYDCEGYYDDADDYYDDEGESSDCSMLGASPNRHKRSERSHRVRNNNIRSVLVNKRHNKYKIAHPQTKLEVINESERSAGSGSDENDSLLVAYNSSSSLASV